jgi:hypothetical protein
VVVFVSVVAIEVIRALACEGRGGLATLEGEGGIRGEGIPERLRDEIEDVEI